MGLGCGDTGCRLGVGLAEAGERVPWSQQADCLDGRASSPTGSWRHTPPHRPGRAQLRGSRNRRAAGHAAGSRPARRCCLGQPPTERCRPTDLARAGTLRQQSLLCVEPSISSVRDLQCVGRGHAARGGRATQSCAVANLGRTVCAAAPPRASDQAGAMNPRRQGHPRACRRKHCGQADGRPKAAKWTTHSSSGSMATSAAASAS